MSGNPAPEFVLFHPGFNGPYRVRADRVEDFGGSLQLRSGARTVAISTPFGLAVDVESLADTSPAAIGCTAPLPAAQLGSFKAYPAPIWPGLVGACFGLFVGIGAALSYVGWW